MGTDGAHYPRLLHDLPLLHRHLWSTERYSKYTQQTHTHTRTQHHHHHHHHHHHLTHTHTQAHTHHTIYTHAHHPHTRFLFVDKEFITWTMKQSRKFCLLFLPPSRLCLCFDIYIVLQPVEGWEQAFIIIHLVNTIFTVCHYLTKQLESRLEMEFRSFWRDSFSNHNSTIAKTGRIDCFVICRRQEKQSLKLRVTRFDWIWIWRDKISLYFLDETLLFL